METITVIAGLIFKERRVLLARRSPDKHLAGYWEFPGGKVEKNEKEEDCLRRELMEELGINVSVINFFMLNHHQYKEKNITLKSYFCKVEEPENFCLNDHDKIEWVKVENLLDYQLAPADIPIAKALNERNSI